ncbi:MAG: hypothetical protein K0R39_2114 [Symbiobacteriaceae bacterium]|nr:hypothetical protein [Symbiobacteriaceae bacterium]
MAERIALSGAGWQIAGFHGEDWRFRTAYRRETKVKDHEWLPATVPGSIHWDLLKAGEIPDPYFERNSRLVEWVHQRHWAYRREITIPEDWAGRRIRLRFDGIDYEAEVFLDGELVGEHESMFRPAVFDITDKATPGATHLLVVIIKDAPREWGQLGHTSTVHTGKARMGYWWDFATRLVNLGLWQDVWLEAAGPCDIRNVWVRAYQDGTVRVATLPTAGDVSVEIRDPAGAVIASGEGTDVTLRVADPQLWWPHTLGAQPLYTALVTVPGDSRGVTFGFRTITLEQNPWPYESEEKPLPYTFTVNGQRLFVKGFNWVPIDHMYGRPDLGERYAQLIEQAKAAGANLLRVWGGGLIERERFYDLCDREGMLVWQEFIQSSSGSDNTPPSDDAFLALLEREADAIIPLRRNHPSLAVWCGGNELMDGKMHPATTAEPALALLARKVAELDPDRFFLPTSPSGPIFGCGDENPNPARQHDVHGPWHYRGPIDSYLPYNASTALFHSEFGTQGCLAPASLDRAIAPANQWPPNDTNPHWVHHGAWWMQQHRVKELFGDEAATTIERYWRLSQFLQAENLRYGVESNRRRWPVCSGTIIWQLNEPWPNSHCTNVVDYYLRPKMAYYYVKRAYAPVAASLRYTSPILADGVLRVQPFIASDAPFAGKLTVTVADPAGRVWHRQEGDGAVEWPLPADCSDVIIVTLTLTDANGQVVATNPYLFSRASAPIFGALADLPLADVVVGRDDDRLVLRNDGPGYAFFPAVDIDDARYYWQLSDNYPLLAPGESLSIAVTLTPRAERADTDCPHGRPAGEGPVQVKVTGWNMRPRTLSWEV